MPMPEMRKAIAKLRFLLASIKGKEDELEGLSRQFRRQLERAPSYAIREDNSLDSTLSVLGEIQERLDNVERTRRHLDSIKSRAQDELRALELTAQIEQAKTELAILRAPDGAGEAGGIADRKRVQDLERFIENASIQAGEAITGGVDEAGLTR